MSADPTKVPVQEVLVSACLLGQTCRYDGGHNRDRVLEQQLAQEGMRAVPFCPEEHGGLSTPRPAAWIERDGASAVLDGETGLRTAEGRDVTDEFMAGAQGALELCQERQLTRAFLKERSPSCGVCTTHVDRIAVPGPGVTTALLERNGIECTGVMGHRNGP
ncbi:MAG: hypothetical protein CMJ86_08965 [Planctomycetes bacterium]|jgi:uncharacterized protein YbbK (DUF523 family)|nr:hypothetical protein [Planctomycetota bacterium]